VRGPLLRARAHPPVVAVAIVLAAGCGVDRKCRSDEDCQGREVCLPSGLCGIECRGDDDCAITETCRESRCIAACLGCSFPHAEDICIHGDCSMGECDDGWTDPNGEPGDGCEYACTPSAGGVEICDYADNDCDTLVDEDFDVRTDPANCGECGRICPEPDHSTATCDNSICRYVCDDGWWDSNLLADDGCESDVCIPSGDEVCDMIDNDCDGDVDEGFEKDTPESCGDYCIECNVPNATPACVAGQCEVDTCDEGWIDCVGTEIGCERACTPSGPEVCDGVDNDCDCLADEGLLCCPEGMVTVADMFCMDVWEASRADATEDSPGTDGTLAVSQPDVLPWNTGSGGWHLAEAACLNAGKRLCTPDEWYLACAGAAGLAYCYGDDYDPVICNGIDAHCDDPYAGCGLEDHYAGNTHFIVEPTGSFEDCVNDWGIMDINGNLWEWVGDDGASIRGGAYNCGNSELLHRCDFVSGPTRPAAGFRCCL